MLAFSTVYFVHACASPCYLLSEICRIRLKFSCDSWCRRSCALRCCALRVCWPLRKVCVDVWIRYGINSPLLFRSACRSCFPTCTSLGLTAVPVCINSTFNAWYDYVTCNFSITFWYRRQHRDLSANQITSIDAGAFAGLGNMLFLFVLDSCMHFHPKKYLLALPFLKIWTPTASRQLLSVLSRGSPI